MNRVKTLFKSVVFKNSLWAIVGSVFQNLFLSLFFVILARLYSTEDFAHFIIANTLYQIIVGFSAMGLGQWFIREHVKTLDKSEFVRKFLKMQMLFGVVFLFVNVAIAFFLYDELVIRLLSLLFALNIVFDNIIYSLKVVNIAEFTQKKTFIILSIEALIKLMIGCLLFMFPFSVIWLGCMLVLVRILTLNIFLRIGAPSYIKTRGFLKYRITWTEIWSIIYLNWPFIIIGSASIVYWRISSIIISKFLDLADVANYEISYKIFSVAQLMPIVIAATIFPKLVKLYGENDLVGFKSLYKKIFAVYSLFGLVSFTFVFSFADILLPLAFGFKYTETAGYVKEMFLTMLVFPTAILQANVLVAMNMEKFDMWFNVVSVFTNVFLCLIGLYFVQSLSIINYSIFISFIIFHILQDVVLIRRGILEMRKYLGIFILICSLFGLFIFLSKFLSSYKLFIFYWSGFGVFYCSRILFIKILRLT